MSFYFLGCVDDVLGTDERNCLFHIFKKNFSVKLFFFFFYLLVSKYKIEFIMTSFNIDFIQLVYWISYLNYLLVTRKHLSFLFPYFIVFYYYYLLLLFLLLFSSFWIYKYKFTQLFYPSLTSFGSTSGSSRDDFVRKAT